MLLLGLSEQDGLLEKRALSRAEDALPSAPTHSSLHLLERRWGWGWLGCLEHALNGSIMEDRQGAGLARRGKCKQ